MKRILPPQPCAPVHPSPPSRSGRAALGVAVSLFHVYFERYINFVIPGPSPASSAMEPGIQLLMHRSQELDSGFGLQEAAGRPGMTNILAMFHYRSENDYIDAKNREIAMPFASITSKGRITIPASVRKAMQVEAGDRVQFIDMEPGRYELVAATQPLTTLKGMFGKPAKGVTIKQMNAAIAGARAR